MFYVSTTMLAALGSALCFILSWRADGALSDFSWIAGFACFAAAVACGIGAVSERSILRSAGVAAADGPKGSRIPINFVRTAKGLAAGATALLLMPIAGIVVVSVVVLALPILLVFFP